MYGTCRDIAFVAAALVLCAGGFLMNGCADSVSGARIANEPPRTFLWTDTLNLVQSSQVRVHWWGDDPDGFVQGYLVSIDGIQWNWTTSQESTFTIALGGVDSILAMIRVSAVDERGNGRRDASVSAGGITFGPEPFADADSNGMYTEGEAFVDFGAIDPTPAFLNVAVKNTPPTVDFVQNTDIPAVTLPVASFLLQGRDVDGNETIVRYFVALNDTAGTWTELPGSISLLTLSGDLSNPSDTVVSAKIFSGTGLTDPGISIPGMALNANNVLWVYAEDIAGSRGAVSRMPDTTRTWFVKKPSVRRKLLVIDDFSGGTPNPDVVYASALDSAQDGSGSTFGDYDVLDLQTNPIPGALHIPMLLQTMRQYSMVFWYARIANFNYAQNTLPDYMNGGGKVLMTTGFQNFVDPLGLPIDFAPVDSLITEYVDSVGNPVYGYISRVYGTSVVSSTDTTRYPRMVVAGSSSSATLFGYYAITPALGDSAIYRLDLPRQDLPSPEPWLGTPPVGIRSNNGRMIFFSFPLYLLGSTDEEGRNRLIRFFESVLRDDFGG